jgi:outer membrane protein TolC
MDKKTKNMKVYKIVLITVSLLITSALSAQQVREMTLQEAIDYAMEHNYNILKSEKDVEAAKYLVKEKMAYGMPQINASVDYKDNIARPVSLLPGEFMGQPGTDVEIQFGTRYNANVGGSLTQLIFSGEYLIGLKASKRFFEKTNVDFFKNKVALKKQVAGSYYNVLATAEALRVIDSTLETTNKLYLETKQVFEAGMAEDTDVDQMELLVENLIASRTNFTNQLGITEAFLKFYLGMESNDSIILTEDINSLVEQKKKSLLLQQQFDYSRNPDYSSLFKQKEISALQLDLAKSAYWPSLMANLNAGTNAQRDEWNFFDSKGKWYFSAFWGVTMKIPILSGGMRMAKVNQAKIAFEQINLMEKQMVTQLQLQYQTIKNDYMNTLLVLQNKKKNTAVAKKIYQKTQEKYKNGMASSLDILNTHSQFLTAENQYITASINFLNAAEAFEAILTKIQNQ